MPEYIEREALLLRMRKLLLCNMGGMGEQILLRSSSRIVGLWRSFLCIRQTRV